MLHVEISSITPSLEATCLSLEQTCIRVDCPLGNVPTTFVLRLISLLNHSSLSLVQILNSVSHRNVHVYKGPRNAFIKLWSHLCQAHTPRLFDNYCFLKGRLFVFLTLIAFSTFLKILTNTENFTIAIVVNIYSYESRTVFKLAAHPLLRYIIYLSK